MSVGPWQIVLIALVVLLLFGAGRLSEIGKGLGEGIRNFKKGLADDDKEKDDDEEEEEEKPPKQLPAPKKKAKLTEEEKDEERA